MTPSNGETPVVVASIPALRNALPAWTTDESCDGRACPPRPKRGADREAPEVKAMERIDGWLAQRVKQARLERDLSQEGLAQKLGISLQQVHKYEAGRNRISVARIAAIAQALGKPLDAFFEGLEENDATAGSPAQRPAGAGPLERERECLELVRNFEQVNKPGQRRALLAFLRALTSDKSD